MLRLVVLLTAAVCCNACRFEEMDPQDTTSNPQGCSDSDGNLHEFQSDWENEDEICVCVTAGIICCERFETTTPPETTIGIIYDDFGAFTDDDTGELENPSIFETTTSPEIIYDDFGAFTEGDTGEPETPSNDEEIPTEVSNQPDSSPEVIADDSQESVEDSV